MKNRNHPEFDFTAATIARDEAIDRVEANAEPDWKEEAEQAVLDVARRGNLFTTDDIWKELALRFVSPPHEPRAMGAVFRRLAAAKLIRPLADDFQKSIMTSCHRRPKQKWIGI